MKSQPLFTIHPPLSERIHYKVHQKNKPSIVSFVESFISKNSRELLVTLPEEKVRYIHQDLAALKKLEKMVHLYENLETDLEKKGVNTKLLTTLTHQEKKIITLIAEGSQSKEIADTLFISKHTVQTHRKNIYRKLNVTSVADLIKISLVLNL
ncbi:helix-turn-helix domain-containing protein [Marinirhabdus gelatinilytica]|uniref:Regulatory LuxR family protein n=1 Tax=Marinirhabdus gelatinilytica TaxID=1703343 RepID=A0A370QFE7_9FLAO|nr:helix-turn-helix transcriptional regulator [Marinirhabdus gelatinilytica]RDK87096.1 regulatory LuxR family protein [Marinirhabdus gelatinilytica]